MMTFCRAIVMKTACLSPWGVRKASGKGGSSVLGGQRTVLNRWHWDHTFANEREWNLAPAKQNGLILKHLRN